MNLNANIPSFKCLIRASHLTKKDTDKHTYHNAYAFGIQSITGKILTFHVMTDYGMLRSRVPISELFIKEPDNDIPNHFKQLWDCFSENTTITKFDYLNTKKCQVVLKDGTKVWATYMFTVDWFNNPYSDEPSDYKCGHVLVADEGYLMCQPNNRIYWRDSNWVTKDFPIEKKDIKVDEVLTSVESYSDRWVSEDTDSFYYDINKQDNGKEECISNNR
jgi:hypothetical protein